MSVYVDIRAERIAQQVRFLPEHDDALTYERWAALIRQYAAEARAKAINNKPDEYRYALIQAAVSAIAAVEAYDRVGLVGSAPNYELRPTVP